MQIIIFFNENSIQYWIQIASSFMPQSGQKIQGIPLLDPVSWLGMEKHIKYIYATFCCGI